MLVDDFNNHQWPFGTRIPASSTPPMSAAAPVRASPTETAPPARGSSLGDKAANAVAAALNSSALQTAGRLAAGALYVGIAMETGTILDAPEVVANAGELAFDAVHSKPVNQPNHQTSKPVTGDDVRAFASAVGHVATAAAELATSSLHKKLSIGAHFNQDAMSGEVWRLHYTGMRLHYTGMRLHYTGIRHALARAAA